MYSAAVAVLMDELLKLGFCLGMLVLAWRLSIVNFASLSNEEGARLTEEGPNVPEQSSALTFLGFMKSTVLTRSFVHMAVPALCYAVQKNLLFAAVSNLDAATFQVAYQGKIVTTALFAVLLLKQRLNTRQWVGLLLLLGGVALVQLSDSSSSSSTAKSHDNQTIGYLSVLGACFTSGFASVYFEWVLKKDENVTQTPPQWYDIWVKNFQLAVFASLSASIGVVALTSSLSEGIFKGFTFLAWTVVVMQAMGGLLVALVIKYADNILKNFAAAVSIVVSVVVSALFLGFHITIGFSIGAILVMIAVVLYTSDPETPILSAFGISRVATSQQSPVEEFELTPPEEQLSLTK